MPFRSSSNLFRFNSPSVGPAPTRRVLWTAEGTSLSEWVVGGTGGFFDTPPASESISSDYAYSGSTSLKCTVDASTPNVNVAVRAFAPWVYINQNREIYFKAWYLFPRAYTLTGNPATGQFLILHGTKTQQNGGANNDPVLNIVLLPDGGGGLYPAVTWGNNSIAGPYSGDAVGFKQFNPGTNPPPGAVGPRAPSIPVGSWFSVEFFLRQANDFSGTVTVAVNDSVLWTFQNVVTSYTNTDTGNAWKCKNEFLSGLYTDGMTPPPNVIYIGRAQLSIAA